MYTVSCYGYTTHAHISFDVSTRSIDDCTLLLQLWAPVSIMTKFFCHFILYGGFKALHCTSDIHFCPFLIVLHLKLTNFTLVSNNTTVDLLSTIAACILVYK